MRWCRCCDAEAGGERRRRLPARLRQPGARADACETCWPRRLAGPAGLAGVGRLTRNAGVGAVLDHRRQRLRPADDGALPAASSRQDLRAIGLSAPIFMMLSGGGLTTHRHRLPLPDPPRRIRPRRRRHLLGQHRPPMRPLDRVLSFDMGGTTAKICLIDDFQPQTSRSFEVARVGRFRKGSGLPLRIPVIEMVEIGAGGGSIAHVDSARPDRHRSRIGRRRSRTRLLRPRRHPPRRDGRQPRPRPLRSGAVSQAAR